MKKVFIDGSAGTTGLRIIERLQGRKDIEILTLSDDKETHTTSKPFCAALFAIFTTLN